HFPLCEVSENMTLAYKLVRVSQRVAVSHATTNGKRAGPAQDLADHRYRDQLRLRHDVERSPREGAEERRVERGEVVRGDHRAAFGRQALDAVAARPGCKRHRDPRRGRARQAPEPVRILSPEL